MVWIPQRFIEHSAISLTVFRGAVCFDRRLAKRGFGGEAGFYSTAEKQRFAWASGRSATLLHIS
jgi:hypothetical protein